jgi:hypothetical protein
MENLHLSELLFYLMKTNYLVFRLLATLDPKKMTNGVAFCRHTKTTNAKCDPSSADNFVSYQLGQNLDTTGYKPFSAGGTSYSTVAFKSLLQLRSGM